ncbi:hypothetical protein SAMN05216548_11454 [Faunimonas pinastri]|uniref:Uncharacterized protein n=1 Tax=Faunimonas pinastri TaxID=1855383 RepID=A0A1H9MUW4_9HYPH|nr:hypothetical protein [Faunimonas pinastri]SER27307.1 hypothetical protein SAMN05216548_11454 [Faunimonas pinastri]
MSPEQIVTVRQHSLRPGFYIVEGADWDEVSRRPSLAAAQECLRRGASPQSILTIQHENGGRVSAPIASYLDQ